MHACCAPCTTASLEEIIEQTQAEITMFFYNPNISPKNEYLKRLTELDRYLKERYNNKIPLIEGEYDFSNWKKLIAPLASTGERGERCRICYYLRLLKTFEKAKELGFDAVSTTLTISPYKKYSWLRDLGNEMSKYFKIEYIVKKWNYKKSIELSEKYNLYRQDYCGCAFSLKEREEYLKRKKEYQQKNKKFLNNK